MKRTDFDVRDSEGRELPKNLASLVQDAGTIKDVFHNAKAQDITLYAHPLTNGIKTLDSRDDYAIIETRGGNQPRIIGIHVYGSSIIYHDVEPSGRAW